MLIEQWLSFETFTPTPYCIKGERFDADHPNVRGAEDPVEFYTLIEFYPNEDTP
jgi:hypothetical protein